MIPEACRLSGISLVFSLLTTFCRGEEHVQLSLNFMGMLNYCAESLRLTTLMLMHIFNPGPNRNILKVRMGIINRPRMVGSERPLDKVDQILMALWTK